MSMKYSNDTIGNRTRDLPACSAMPQRTASPRAPNRTLNWLHNYLNSSWRTYTNYVDIRRWYLCFLGCYSSYGSDSLSTFREAYRVPCSRFKKSFLPFCFLAPEDVPMGCSETSIRSYQCSLRNIPKENISYIIRGGSLISHILEYGRELGVHNYVAEESCWHFSIPNRHWFEGSHEGPVNTQLVPRLRFELVLDFQNEYGLCIAWKRIHVFFKSSYHCTEEWVIFLRGSSLLRVICYRLHPSDLESQGCVPLNVGWMSQGGAIRQLSSNCHRRSRVGCDPKYP